MLVLVPSKVAVFATLVVNSNSFTCQYNPLVIKLEHLNIVFFTETMLARWTDTPVIYHNQFFSYFHNSSITVLSCINPLLNTFIFDWDSCKKINIRSREHKNYLQDESLVFDRVTKMARLCKSIESMTGYLPIIFEEVRSTALVLAMLFSRHARNASADAVS